MSKLLPGPGLFLRPVSKTSFYTLKYFERREGGKVREKEGREGKQY